MILTKKIIPFLLGGIFFVSVLNAQNNEPIIENKVTLDPIEFVENFLPNIAVAAVPLEAAKSETPKVTAIAPNTKHQEKFGEGVLNWIQDKYSSVLQVLPNQITNVMLYRFIDEWSGVKYRMGGTNKSGIDCSAFVQTLYQYVFGMNLLRTARMQFSEANLIRNVNDLKEGDLVFFRINSSYISHVGVYLKNNFFVHSASSKGVSIANLTSDYWNKYFVGGGRVMN